MHRVRRQAQQRNDGTHARRRWQNVRPSDLISRRRGMHQVYEAAFNLESCFGKSEAFSVLERPYIQLLPHVAVKGQRLGVWWPETGAVA